MAKKRRAALGRGLSSLIPVEQDGSGGDMVAMVDARAIRTNPFQPRQHFPEEEIRELAESIKVQGLLQPVLLRKKTQGYELISGERRFRALRLLGNDTIPAIVKDRVTDTEMLEIALVENLQRENLNEIEKARAYQRLLVECGLSHEDLAGRVGKSRSAVTNALRLLNLEEEIQELVRQGALSAGHARALAGIEDREARRNLAQRAVQEAMSVREIERSALGPKPASTRRGRRQSPSDNGGKGSHGTPDPDLLSQIEQLRYRFGTSVRINRTAGGKGRIEIDFFSDQDLDRLLHMIAA